MTAGAPRVADCVPTLPSVLRRIVAIALVAALAVIGSALPAAAEAEVAFTLDDERITESSGLTRDTAAGRYWTVNDSGDSGRVFALDADGQVEGTVNFRADVVDVEAVQSSPNGLYVADIGDNNGDREFITVYILNDLVPDDRTVLYRAFDLAYPDGAHDAETLLISPDGVVSVVTKGADAGIYSAPASPSHESVNTLTRVADAPAYVTDGQFLDDGRIALRSYVDVQIVDPEDDYGVVARAAAPFQQQGESLTQNLDGDALLLGSEGEASDVYSMPVPEAMDEAPDPDASPPASSAPAEDDSESGDEPADGAEPPGDGDGSDTDAADTTGPNRRGTLVALLLALLVAGGAGTGAFWLRGRVSDG